MTKDIIIVVDFTTTYIVSSVALSNQLAGRGSSTNQFLILLASFLSYLPATNKLLL